MVSNASFPLPVTVIFIIFLIWFLHCIFRPKPVINFSIKWWKWYLRIFGFESEIKPTEKAVIILRIWSLLMLLFCIVILSFGISGKLK